MVHWMSKGQDATARGPNNEDPMLEVIRLQNPASPYEQMEVLDRIKATLADGRAVAVVPIYADTAYAWDDLSISLLAGRPNDFSSLVEWQCTLIRRIKCDY